ncbi:MAG TPA: HisA/HisF-related TIM barrel protein [Terriglobales bacterium]|nr:HisA/HisF-related TIM barrel protein [Terriglobales bacterium]
MLIPAIDLMGGKIVQLIQGEKKALEYDDFEPWIQRFSRYPVTQIIDLDAAKRVGNNREQVRMLLGRLPCQVGGGIHDAATARQLLDYGAVRVIFGSSLLRDGEINVAFAEQLAAELGNERLVFAIDSRGGKVAVKGWQERTAISPYDMIRLLAPYCHSFLYTHIDTEGTMSGLPMDVAKSLREATTRKLILAGGIKTQEEIDTLDKMGIDAVAGMAVYTGKIKA